jgi:NADPH2:quinone reductase
MTALPPTSLQLRSRLSKDGRLTLHLVEADIGPVGEDEVVVRIEATPINPSDLGLLIGPIDLSGARASGAGPGATVTAEATPGQLRALAARVDQDLPVGNEGAGVVVAAGGGAQAQALLGKVVGMAGGAMYQQYRRIRVRDVLEMPRGVSPAEAASPFVNPMTALSMVETMRREGHTALVHTAAASNLGQMLVRLCAAENIPLINIVRSPAQAKILHDIGARHVLDSSDQGFMAALIDALAQTGATLAFDAIGGGKLASQILTAMEQAANRKMDAYSRYGSSVYKQVYIYGGLDIAPTELTRAFGFSWGLGGWLLTPFLQKLGPEGVAAMRTRVAREITTTFASRYTRVISLDEALDLSILKAYARRATGEKYLIDPSRPLAQHA